MQIKSILLTALGVLLFAVACASPTPAAPPPTSAPAAPVSTPVPNVPTAAPAAPVATATTAAALTDPNARVVVAQAVDVTTLDPNTDTVITNRNVQMNMFDSLIERGHDMKFKPGLALSWESVDPVTWKFVLRKDVKFHNGSPFTAEDVKFTIDRIKSDKDLKSRMTLYVDAITDVVVNDSSTVTIKTKDPYPLLLTRMSAVPIVNKETVQKMGLEEFAKKPVGTGPFRFVEWVKDQRVVMERYDDHWRGKAGIKTLVFRPIPEDAVRVSELLTGGINVGVRVSSDSIPQLEKAGLAVKGVPSVRLLHGVMDMSKKPFDDKRVRQAVNYAVNVDAIIKNLLNGHAYRATQPVDPLTFGYSSDIKPYTSDLGKAKQLLTEAGYPNGFEISFEATTAYKQVAEAIAQQLAQVGIKATIVIDESSVQLRKVTEKKIEPLFLFSWGSSTFDADGTTYSLLRTGQLYSMTSLAELDKIVDQAHVITNQEQRLKLYKDAHTLIREEAPFLFLWQLEDLYGVTKKVNWNPRVDEMLWFYDATVAP